jgi:hypothetical protein
MLLQYGVPLDAGALTYALRDMQVGGLERLVSTYTADTNQVAREHVEFLRGKELHVREVDNHQVHIVGHKDFAKGPRFLALPDGDQARLIKHIHDHEAAAGAGAQMPPGLPAPPPGAIPTQPSGNPMPDLNQAPPEAGSTGS